MTSKLVVNTIEADTGISSVSFASSISMSSTSKFHFSAAGIDIGADTNINRPAAGVLGFNINDSQKVVITSNGRLGIGTNNPTQLIEVQDRSTGTVCGLNVGTQYGNAHFGGYNNYPAIMNSGNQPLIYCDTNNDRTVLFGDTVGFGTTCAFRVNNAERLRIASDGATKVCHNGGAFGVGGDPINKFGITASDNNFFGLHRSNASTGTGEFNINVETNSQVTFSMDDEGAFSFGTSTDPSAQSGYSEKLRIASDGKIGIGVASPTRTVDMHVTDSGANYLHLTNTGTGTGDGNGIFIGLDAAEGALIWNQEDNYVRFGTDNTERFRIHNNGTMSFLNTTFPYSEHFHFYAGISNKPGMSIYYGTDSDESALIMRHGRSGANSGAWTGKLIQFRNSANNENGSIASNASVTAYNTRSDYRLKENEDTISDAISKVKQLKPYTFNFKVTPDQKVDGFFAHEAQEVVSYAVLGEKDAEDMQQMDYGKLTPLLTAALKEAVTEIESLKSRLDAAGL